MTGVPSQNQVAFRLRGVSTDPSERDDFVEFLTRTYAPVLARLSAHGLSGAITRVGQDAFALVVTGPDGQRVDISDAGRPLPDSPADVRSWSVHQVSGPKPERVDEFTGTVERALLAEST
jgi:hypothetical protein